jgi:hypothetical protein
MTQVERPPDDGYHQVGAVGECGGCSHHVYAVVWYWGDRSGYMYSCWKCGTYRWGDLSHSAHGRGYRFYERFDET